MKLSVGAVLLAMALPALGAPATINLAGLSSPVTYGTKRVEQAYSSRSPDTFVKTSVVHLYVPLNTTVSHAPECDYISYLRFRHRDGPADFLKADRIETFMPGTIAGASSAEQLARNVVYYSQKNHQQYVEFWAMDRRSNCLDDQTGAFEAVKQNNPSLAIDYYYNKKSINGRTFQGFKSGNSPDTAFIAELGLDQTSSDWYDIVTREMPDQTFRTTKHYASGHSLGGPLTAYFAAYDRDGDVNTTKDAGYNQAAGFIGYDTIVKESLAGASALPEAVAKVLQPIIQLGFDVSLAGFRSGLLPRSLLTALPVVLNSEAAQLLSILGARATLNPKAEADVKGLPRTPTIITAAQFFFSKTLVNFATFFPSAFNLRATNEALVGAILGDRFQAFGFLQASVGFANGGALAEKSFPVGTAPADIPRNSSLLNGVVPLLSKYPLAVPDDAGSLGLGNGPVYGWLNYNEIAADGSNVAKSNDGKPFVTAAVEVTDIADLNRALSEPPLDFTEHYYPTRVTTDVAFLGLSSEASKIAPHTIHRGAFAKRPVFNVVGSEGLALGMGALGNHVIADGYNHLDVLLAARKQNLGRKEVSSISTSNFISKLGAGVLS